MTTFRTVGYNAKPENPANSVGKALKVVPSDVLVDVSALANGDVFVLAGPLSLDARINKIAVNKLFDMAEANDNDFGFYYKDSNSDSFVVIDKDILVDGVDLTSGSGLAPGYDILTANASLDRTKNIGELLSKKSDSGYNGVYLCWTMNVKEATADMTVRLQVEYEEATTA